MVGIPEELKEEAKHVFPDLTVHTDHLEQLRRGNQEKRRQILRSTRTAKVQVTEASLLLVTVLKGGRGV